MLTLKVISDLVTSRPQYKKTKKSDIKKIWMANVVKKKLSIEDTPLNKIKLQGIIVKGLRSKTPAKPITLNKPKPAKRIETGPLNKGKVVKAPAKPKAKPSGFLAGPKMPPRKSSSGGTGVINVLDDKKKLNMMDMIQKYMSETGKIPSGPKDPSFVKWLRSQKKSK